MVLQFRWNKSKKRSLLQKNKKSWNPRWVWKTLWPCPFQICWTLSESKIIFFYLMVSCNNKNKKPIMFYFMPKLFRIAEYWRADKTNIAISHYPKIMRGWVGNLLCPSQVWLLSRSGYEAWQSMGGGWGLCCSYHGTLHLVLYWTFLIARKRTGEACKIGTSAIASKPTLFY